jgi:hypothetical protein
MSQPAFYWNKISTSATYTATDTLSGTDVEDIQYTTEDTDWGPADVSGTKSIIIDNGADLTVDTLCLLGDNLNGVTLEIRGSTDNFSTSDVLVSAGATLTSLVNTAYRSFAEATYRYWKFNFTTFPSTMRIDHLALDLQVLLPFFEVDPDEGNVTPTAVHLVSKGGLYLGSAQDKSERRMTLDFGEITDTEKVDLLSWANAVIKEVNPFFVHVDTSTSLIHFGYLDNAGSWAAPLDMGVSIAKPNTFITRAI